MPILYAHTFVISLYIDVHIPDKLAFRIAADEILNFGTRIIMYNPLKGNMFYSLEKMHPKFRCQSAVYFFFLVRN